MKLPNPTDKRHPGVSAAWANLPRRRCDDCGKNYKPVRPVKEGERGFCADNCRKSYHKHGGAYRKLKVEMQRMVAREFVGIHAELKELRALWIETESRYVAISTRLDEVAYRAELPVGFPRSSPAAHRANR